jgi:hypothetical protein
MFHVETESTVTNDLENARKSLGYFILSRMHRTPTIQEWVEALSDSPSWHYRVAGKAIEFAFRNDVLPNNGDNRFAMFSSQPEFSVYDVQMTSIQIAEWIGKSAEEFYHQFASVNEEMEPDQLDVNWMVAELVINLGVV